MPDGDTEAATAPASKPQPTEEQRRKWRDQYHRSQAKKKQGAAAAPRKRKRGTRDFKAEWARRKARAAARTPSGHPSKVRSKSQLKHPRKAWTPERRATYYATVERKRKEREQQSPRQHHPGMTPDEIKRMRKAISSKRFIDLTKAENRFYNREKYYTRKARKLAGQLPARTPPTKRAAKRALLNSGPAVHVGDELPENFPREMPVYDEATGQTVQHVLMPRQVTEWVWVRKPPR